MATQVNDNGDYTALRDHYLSEMNDWLEGRRSWTNLGWDPPYTPDVIAAMDTAEVQKYAAAAATYGVLAAMQSARAPQSCPDCDGAGYVETSRGPVECDCNHEAEHNPSDKGERP